MNPTRRRMRRRNEIQRVKSRKGVLARERLRAERSKDDPGWTRVFTLLVIGEAAPDGRTLGLHVHGQKDWYRCGTARAVRAALARMMVILLREDATKDKGARMGKTTEDRGQRTERRRGAKHGTNGR